MVAPAAASASARNVCGQRPHQLAQRRLGLAGDRRRRPDEQEQRLRLGGGQPAEVGAGAADERPAAAAAGLRVDRDARPRTAPPGRGGRWPPTPPARRRARRRSPGPAACISSRAATSRSARMSPIFARQSAQLVSTLGGRWCMSSNAREKEPAMLRGLTTVTFFADDLAAAARLVHRAARRRAVLRPRGRRRAGLRRVPDRRLPARARHHRQPLRPAGPAEGPAARSPTGPSTTSRPTFDRLLALGATVHQPSRSSGAPASSPRRSSTRSATSSASCTTSTTSTCSEKVRCVTDDRHRARVASRSGGPGWPSTAGPRPRPGWSSRTRTAAMPERHLCRGGRAGALLRLDRRAAAQARRAQRPAPVQPAPAAEQVERAQPRAGRADDRARVR